MNIYEEEEPGICEKCDEYAYLWWVEEECALLCKACLEQAIEQNKAKIAALIKQ